MFAKNPNRLVLCDCQVHSDEIPTTDGLAFDLKDLDELRKHGKPISSMSLDSQYYDGSENASFDFPSDVMRGVDINDMWQEMQDGKRKFSKVGVNNVQIS